MAENEGSKGSPGSVLDRFRARCTRAFSKNAVLEAKVQALQEQLELAHELITVFQGDVDYYREIAKEQDKKLRA